MWTDRDLVTDCLVAEKALAHHYSTAVEHTDDGALMQTLMNLCADAQQNRLQIYQLMHRRGWYNPSQADPMTVAQSAQKFTQTHHQLQSQVGWNQGPSGIQGTFRTI
ncbi:MAG TPA: spore coat protein [Symbiobacteriaceae bacterium]|nr:spore coat protein [Symbiobacteriaceae bacterium]